LVHADNGAGNITDVDVSLVIYGQPAVSIVGGNDAIETLPFAIGIQDLRLIKRMGNPLRATENILLLSPGVCQ
jgi:hypothetical protein